ncbi:MAG: hypothetical protein K0R80_140 [Clostridia bacterium]|jgi:hypothetical protein|nr:hypothetical protein [Clostridia bacterium]
MIDEDLRQRMEAAYLHGNKKLALELSQELDEQVAKEQNRKLLKGMQRSSQIDVLISKEQY